MNCQKEIMMQPHWLKKYSYFFNLGVSLVIPYSVINVNENLKMSTGRTIKESDPSGLKIYIILLAGETSEGKGNK